MKKSVQLLEAGFENSSSKTPEFKNFAKVFKKEFSCELKSVGATDIKFNVGHFQITGFFTVQGQAYYFSLPDVRGYAYCKATNPDSNFCKLMYRTAKDYKDYTGSVNRYVNIRFDMSADMCWYFKVV